MTEDDAVVAADFPMQLGQRLRSRFVVWLTGCSDQFDVTVSLMVAPMPGYRHVVKMLAPTLPSLAFSVHNFFCHHSYRGGNESASC